VIAERGEPGGERIVERGRGRIRRRRPELRYEMAEVDRERAEPVERQVSRTGVCTEQRRDRGVRFHGFLRRLGRQLADVGGLHRSVD
jgi:hypothetical protein